MNKQQFKRLSEEEKLNFINDELKNKTLEVIAEELSVSPSFLSSEFRGLGYKYSRANCQYVKDEEKKSTLPTGDLTEEEVIEALKWASERAKKNDPLIEIDPRFSQGEMKKKSFLIHELALAEWEQFSRKQFSHKQQNLISMALLEYIENHS